MGANSFVNANTLVFATDGSITSWEKIEKVKALHAWCIQQAVVAAASAPVPEVEDRSGLLAQIREAKLSDLKKVEQQQPAMSAKAKSVRIADGGVGGGGGDLLTELQRAAAPTRR